MSNLIRSGRYRGDMINTTGTIYLVRAQVFPKTDFSEPLTCTCTYTYKEVRCISFSENFTYVLNGWCISWKQSRTKKTKKQKQKQIKLEKLKPMKAVIITITEKSTISRPFGAGNKNATKIKSAE